MHRFMHYVKLLLQQQQRQSQPLAFLLFDFDASTIFATPVRTKYAAPATANTLRALEASRLLSAKDDIARARGSWIDGDASSSNAWSTLAAILSPSALRPSSDKGFPIGGGG